MSDVKQKEVLWINSLKGGCILLVVLHHSIITTFVPAFHYLTAGILPAEIWISFNNSLSPLRMPAFFFVSGLLAASAISKRGWKDVFTKKITNLIYLYIIWGVIQWICIYNISSNLIGERLSTSKNSAYAETFFEFIKLLFFAMTSLWYLYALAIFFFASKLLNRHRMALLILAIAVNYTVQFNLIPGWGPASVAQNYLYFVLGGFFSETIIEMCKINRKNFFILITIAIIGMLHQLVGIYKNPFYSLIAIVFGIILCRILNKLFNMHWLNYIGRNTLQIYVLHRIYIELFGLCILTLATHNNWFNRKLFSIIWATGMPIVAVAICTVVSLLTWLLLNHGLGRILFSYPSLLRKPLTTNDTTRIP